MLLVCLSHIGVVLQGVRSILSGSNTLDLALGEIESVGSACYTSASASVDMIGEADWIQELITTLVTDPNGISVRQELPLQPEVGCCHR